MGKEMFRNLITKTREMPPTPGPIGKTKPSSYVVCDVSEANVKSFLEDMRKLGVETGDGEGLIRVARSEYRMTR